MSTPLSEQIETPRASRVITVLKAVRRAPRHCSHLLYRVVPDVCVALEDADLPVHPHLQ